MFHKQSVQNISFFLKNLNANVNFLFWWEVCPNPRSKMFLFFHYRQPLESYDYYSDSPDLKG